MKIKNLEELEAKIDKDLAWRKLELFQLKFAIESQKMGISKRTLSRSGIALLCAHWEGFIRNVANYYLIYICNQKVKTRLLKENFFAFKLKKDVLSCGKSPKNSVHTQLIMKMESLQEQNFFIKYIDSPSKRIVNTDSNLSFELFDEILKSVDIENIYITKKNYIDNEMLKYRHAIVHGENDEKKEYNFQEVYMQVLSIMEGFKNQVIEAAENKKYLKYNKVI
ncbi:MAG: hypothetical protein K0S25_129 [Bacillus sp. (in: firmicutes)]|jgi:hypothetical protein|nr:hypothetical protein [Bacillus sp. (in: firmicutes)]